MAGMALKDRVELSSIVIPLEVAAKIVNIFSFFWRNLIADLTNGV